MLAPDDVSVSVAKIRRFYMGIIAADAFSYMIGKMAVSKLDHEASWISSLRSCVTLLSDSGNLWENERPSILSNVLSAFTTYKNAFTSTASFLARMEDGRLAAKLIERLISKVDENLKSAHSMQEDYENWLKNVENHVYGISECHSAGQRNLSASKNAIAHYANAIVSIQDKLGALQGNVPVESITSGAVPDLSGVLTSIVNLVYNLAIAGRPRPYITMGVMFFTREKQLFDTFVASRQIRGELENLSVLKRPLSVEQQALAQTTASLKMLFDMKEIISAQRNPADEISSFWLGEKRKLISVRDSFASDSRYTNDNTEVLQLPIACTVWSTLQDVVSVLHKKTEEGDDAPAIISIG